MKARGTELISEFSAGLVRLSFSGSLRIENESKCSISVYAEKGDGYVQIANVPPASASGPGVAEAPLSLLSSLGIGKRVNLFLNAFCGDLMYPVRTQAQLPSTGSVVVCSGLYKFAYFTNGRLAVDECGSDERGEQYVLNNTDAPVTVELLIGGEFVPVTLGPGEKRAGKFAGFRIGGIEVVDPLRPIPAGGKALFVGTFTTGRPKLVAVNQDGVVASTELTDLSEGGVESALKALRDEVRVKPSNIAAYYACAGGECVQIAKELPPPCDGNYHVKRVSWNRKLLVRELKVSESGAEFSDEYETTLIQIANESRELVAVYSDGTNTGFVWRARGGGGASAFLNGVYISDVEPVHAVGGEEVRIAGADVASSYIAFLVDYGGAKKVKVRPLPGYSFTVPRELDGGKVVAVLLLLSDGSRLSVSELRLYSKLKYSLSGSKLRLETDPPAPLTVVKNGQEVRLESGSGEVDVSDAVSVGVSSPILLYDESGNRVTSISVVREALKRFEVDRDSKRVVIETSFPTDWEAVLTVIGRGVNGYRTYARRIKFESTEVYLPDIVSEVSEVEAVVLTVGSESFVVREPVPIDLPRYELTQDGIRFESSDYKFATVFVSDCSKTIALHFGESITFETLDVSCGSPPSAWVEAGGRRIAFSDGSRRLVMSELTPAAIVHVLEDRYVAEVILKGASTKATAVEAFDPVSGDVLARADVRGGASRVLLEVPKVRTFVLRLRIGSLTAPFLSFVEPVLPTIDGNRVSLSDGRPFELYRFEDGVFKPVASGMSEYVIEFPGLYGAKVAGSIVPFFVSGIGAEMGRAAVLDPAVAEVEFEGERAKGVLVIASGVDGRELTVNGRKYRFDMTQLTCDELDRLKASGLAFVGLIGALALWRALKE